MSLVSDSSSKNTFPIALCPCLTTVLLIFSQFVTALGINATVTDDFVSAYLLSGVMMSFGSGYLWLCLKFNNVNLLSVLISLLIKTHQLSEFSFIRKQVGARYTLDGFNALVVALIFVTFSVFVEGLLAISPTLYQYVYLLNNVIFYFLLGLALVQINSNINYLSHNVLISISSQCDRLNGTFTVIKFGVSNISKLIYLTLLLPLFYVNRPMMVSELAFILVFFIFAICGPIRKTLKLYSVWCADSRRISDKVDKTRYINRNVDVSIGDNTLVARSEYTLARTRELIEIKKYVASLSLIILIWLLVITFK